MNRRGWYREPNRHSFAALGIKTRKTIPPGLIVGSKNEFMLRDIYKNRYYTTLKFYEMTDNTPDYDINKEIANIFMSNKNIPTLPSVKIPLALKLIADDSIDAALLLGLLSNSKAIKKFVSEVSHNIEGYGDEIKYSHLIQIHNLLMTIEEMNIPNDLKSQLKEAFSLDFELLNNVVEGRKIFVDYINRISKYIDIGKYSIMDFLNYMPDIPDIIEDTTSSEILQKHLLNLIYDIELLTLIDLDKIDTKSLTKTRKSNIYMDILTSGDFKNEYYLMKPGILSKVKDTSNDDFYHKITNLCDNKYKEDTAILSDMMTTFIGKDLIDDNKPLYEYIDIMMLHNKRVAKREKPLIELGFLMNDVDVVSFMDQKCEFIQKVLRPQSDKRVYALYEAIKNNNMGEAIKLLKELHFGGEDDYVRMNMINNSLIYRMYHPEAAMRRGDSDRIYVDKEKVARIYYNLPKNLSIPEKIIMVNIELKKEIQENALRIAARNRLESLTYYENHKNIDKLFKKLSKADPKDMFKILDDYYKNASVKSYEEYSNDLLRFVKMHGDELKELSNLMKRSYLSAYQKKLIRYYAITLLSG